MENRRWRNTPRLRAYLQALGSGRRPERELELLTDEVLREERVMLGLRLDEPLALDGLAAAVDGVRLARMEQLGLAAVSHRAGGGAIVSLTRRGRLLGGGVTAEILA
jgi:coproporphyrinogen III oxidase-like Fe-S oxidoreductase